MLSFSCDYSQGAHEKVLQRLFETNMESLATYGGDKYSKSAKEKIRQLCECPDADIYFLTGGTETNQIVIASLLKPYQGVITSSTGHIGVHEAGAIELTGHKVLSLPHKEGKIEPSILEEYVASFFADENHEHMVFPGMVYISHPTEYGTLYSLKELKELSLVCEKYDLPLYMDGARLGYGLMSYDTDVTLPDIAKYCDVFYIGGTKVGALCGEAVVFTKQNTPSHFMTRIKQQGALLAKGRLLGIQFDTLFTDSLYFEISRHAIDMAELLKNTFREKGYTFYLDSPTNQIFIVLDHENLRRLKEHVEFSFWEKADENHTIVRFATSWATKEEDIKKLADLL